MTEYLKSLYVSAITQKNSPLKKIYVLSLIIWIMTVIVMIYLSTYIIWFTIGLSVGLIFIVWLDQKIQIEKHQFEQRKQSLFYQIFYPEMLSQCLAIPFKWQTTPIQWMIQEDLYASLACLSHEKEHIQWMAFTSVHQRKPILKILFSLPSFLPVMKYTNQHIAHETSLLMYHHHYVYDVTKKDSIMLEFFDLMERCPGLENIEMIFNGQKAMFMCKIEDVMIVNQYQIKEKTFKQHVKKIQNIQPVYNYIKSSLRELEDAYRK